MENQHEQITGYRDLTHHEIRTMNKIKAKAKEVEELVDQLRGVADYDQRWVSIGVTNLQQGFMALTRAVAKPESF